MLTFFVLGDWGRRGSAAQRSVAQGMARAAHRYDPRFVLSTGNNFFENGVQSVNDAHWTESFQDVYNAPSLSVPWYGALGPRDHEGNITAQIDYAQHDPRWRMPNRYYSFNKRVDDRTHAQFVVLDTTPFTDSRLQAPQASPSKNGASENGASENGAATNGRAENGAETGASNAGASRLQSARTAFDPTLQRHWFRHMLAPSRSAWRLVVGHHPIESASPVHGPTPSLQEQLAPLLPSLGVNAYFCGHAHDLQHLKDNDVHHVVSGAGADAQETGTSPLTRYSASTPGFAVVSLTTDALRLRFCDADGEVIYETLIDRPVAEPTA